MTETITAAQLNAELNNGNRELRQAFARLWGRSRKTNKYGNVRVTTATGEKFDSKREATRHGQLELLARAGTISKLERQVTFDLIVNGILVGRVRPDWTYIEKGVVVAEDSKGYQTRDHKTRWKLAKALFQQVDWRLS